MNTFTKFSLGMMGKLRPLPIQGSSKATIELPPPGKSGGLPLMQALAQRASSREFAPDALPLQKLSDLLWAAFGVNRDDGGRTAPSALNAQEIEIFIALPDGAYHYEHKSHTLHLVVSSDLRRITGYQDFVDDAPLDLIYVADFSRLHMVPAGQRAAYANVCAGAITQNVYLYAASNGIATVIRAWIDRQAMANALGLTHDQDVLLSQTVGYPKVIKPKM